ncbi:hypothetical protein [Streptomyces thinghirensis]|uniref:Uncharacterized protein n=1 Tax=Streptomyces thinghirensis TaxID=551547 RepID=A0ABP9TID2_9ACTN
MRVLPDRVAGTAPATVVREWDNAVAILPLDGVMVPHAVGDGLPLPWTPQQAAARSAAPLD